MRHHLPEQPGDDGTAGVDTKRQGDPGHHRNDLSRQPLPGSHAKHPSACDFGVVARLLENGSSSTAFLGCTLPTEILLR